MADTSPLRVMSIAHGAVRSDLGRIRYRDFVGRSDLSVELVAPAWWREYGRITEAAPVSASDVPLHVEQIRLPYVPAVNWYAHYYPRLGQLIADMKPDVIHLWEEPWSVVALQACRLRGDASLVLEVDQNILKRLPPPFEQIRRYVLRRTDVILARSREAEHVVRACGFAGPVMPIGYGVDQAMFRPPPTKTGRKPGQPLRLGYVGRICEQKGLDDALEAMAMANCPVELSIMGEGPYEPRLRQRIRELGLSDRVTIVGWKGLDAVADLLRGLDASLLLSRTTRSWKEQFGRTIIESQSCGVPVIGSSSGAIPDVIGAGGWIVGERDPAGVTAILERISLHIDELEAKTAAGLDNVASRFTYRIAAENLEAAWREAYRARQSAAGTSVRLAASVPPPASAISLPAVVGGNFHPNFRIVQVVRDMIAGGGVEMVAFELARAWQKTGIDNLTIARDPGEAATAQIRTEQVARWVAKMPTRGTYRYFGRLLVVPVFTVAATWALRRYRNSVVLSHGDSFSGDVLVVHAVNAASIAAKKRSGSWKWMLNPMHAWAGLRDRYMIGGMRYRHFVAVSRRAALELREYYNVPEHRISVIPNGIDPQRFKPDPVSRRRIRSEFGFPLDAKVLLFVGHEFERKGLAHVIAALDRLPEDVRLLVVGSDLQAPYQKLFKGERHRLVFASERLDMPALYSAADAFVLPSQYETFALVGMEAMACGLPVFATRVGGIEDYLEDGVNGFAIQADGADIAAKISAVLHDPMTMAALSAGALTTAQSYAWPAIASRYVTLLHDVWRQKTSASATTVPAHATAQSASRVMPGE